MPSKKKNSTNGSNSNGAGDRQPINRNVLPIPDRDPSWLMVLAPVVERLGALQQSAARYPNIKPGQEFAGYSSIPRPSKVRAGSPCACTGR